MSGSLSHWRSTQRVCASIWHLGSGGSGRTRTERRSPRRRRTATRSRRGRRCGNGPARRCPVLLRREPVRFTTVAEPRAHDLGDLRRRPDCGRRRAVAVHRSGALHVRELQQIQRRRRGPHPVLGEVRVTHGRADGGVSEAANYVLVWTLTPQSMRRRRRAPRSSARTRRARARNAYRNCRMSAMCATLRAGKVATVSHAHPAHPEARKPTRRAVRGRPRPHPPTRALAHPRRDSAWKVQSVIVITRSTTESLVSVTLPSGHLTSISATSALASPKCASKGLCDA